MDGIIDGFIVTAKSLMIIVISAFRNLMPIGVLPRKNVRGQTVLITGSGSGLGRMMAYEFGKLGSKLVLWDINEKGNEETLQHLLEIGADAQAYTIDLSDHHQINKTAEKVRGSIGKIDILINNAGIVTGKKLYDCPDELMIKTMAVNTNSLFFTAKNFLPAMFEENSGHVVTIASMAGKCGNAGLVDYCASKHGAVGFNDSLASEIFSLKKNVKTTVVCPTFISTGMFDGAATKSTFLLPLLTPEYVVECIMEAILTDRSFLALPRFSYVMIAVAGFLPSEVLNLYGEYLGVTSSMDHFKGRRPITS